VEESFAIVRAREGHYVTIDREGPIRAEAKFRVEVSFIERELETALGAGIERDLVWEGRESDAVAAARQLRP
jgi:hypothetical protein